MTPIQTTLYSLLEARGLRTKSFSTYKSKLDKFLSICARRKVTEIAQVDYEFCDYFIKTNRFRSNTTRNSYKVVLSTLFNDALKLKIIDNNPWINIKSHSESKQGKMFFNENQIRQLILHIPEHPRLFMACKLLYYCFIRNTEIVNLPLQDINLIDGTIRVHSSYSKNKKTQTVLIPQEFLPDVRAWYEQQKEQGSHYFISKPNGQKIARGDYFNVLHKKIMTKLGYGSRYSFYSWKHTGAVQFYKATKDLKALQMQLRHHSLDQVDEYLRELGIVEATTIMGHALPILAKKAA